MRLRHCIPLLVLIALLATPFPQASLAQDGGTTCEQLIRQAVTSLGTNCANLGPNSLCYGYAGVEATLIPAGPFDTPGQRAALVDVQSVRTSLADPALGEWGIAMMNVQANLHSATPKMATYYLLGDVEITSAVEPGVALMPAEPVQVTTSAQADILRAPGAGSKVLATVAANAALMADGVSPDGAWVRVLYETRAAWVSAALINEQTALAELPAISKDSRTTMQVFTFRTGGSSPSCTLAPPSVLVVQSPKDTTVDITANGVDIRVASVVFLRSQANGDIELRVADGAVFLFPETARQTRVPVGASVTIPAGGLTWRNWRIPPQEEWDPFDPIGTFPPNLGPYPVPIPIIVHPSGIGGPPPWVDTPGGPVFPFPPKPPFFPWLPPVDGVPGQPRPPVPWARVTLGENACPDGVLYHSDRGDTWDIYMLGAPMPPDGLSQGPDSADAQPSASPDGQWAAFTSDRDALGAWEIFIARVDGSQLQRLTFNSADDINPVWGPDSRIVFESDREGNWDLFLVDVATNDDPVQLTDDEGSDIAPFWSPDGERIYFQSDRGGTWAIYAIELATGEETLVVDTGLEGQNPIVSHDGESLAWLQKNVFGVYDLWIMDLATGQMQQLTDMGVDVGSPTFAPDDTVITFHARLEDNFDVFVVDVETGELKALTTSEADDYAPTFLCQSPIVVFHSDAAAREELPGQRHIFQVPALPMDQPAPAPTQLTTDLEADNIFPMGDPREEINSRQGGM